MQQQRTAPLRASTTRLVDPAETVAEPLKLKDGILVVSGYGLRITVERGHLSIIDGTGSERRSGLVHRATSGIRRLVVLGHSGAISLEALKWLSDVGAAFIQIGRDGEVIACTSMLGSNDARIRRSQAQATANGVGLEIARGLIIEKIERQREIADRFSPPQHIVELLVGASGEVQSVQSITALRVAEARAAAAYWDGWKALDIRFAKRDEARVPQHWRRFDARSSPIANGPRLAVNPVNALLNYLYGILEAETRIACLTLGLDPGMGVLHADQRSRDSLALDLMEPVRPRVDQLVLGIVERQIFTGKDFFETAQGNCRLMPSLAKPLAEYGPTISRWVAPYAEHAARAFGRSSASLDRREQAVATPLTQANRSAGRVKIRIGDRTERPKPSSPLSNACKGCGFVLDDSKRIWCDTCYVEHRPEKDRANISAALAAKAKMRADGQDPAHGGAVAEKRRATHLEQMRLNAEWEASNHPTKSNVEYHEQILPLLAHVAVREIAKLMNVSRGYAAMVKRGDRTPHRRHWNALKDADAVTD
jgi:CRISPR-associated endonuclease Cas1